ncbi:MULTISPECIES: hypothetical protein [unclassified Clostridium]|uniref:hypothetical protein n=1 Tax=unclassified Clostridium TaxID=2614128 RepID=UPI000297CAD4|nr:MULTISPECIES: hypothetical protein [unclassified Clostridium]EKQ56559.1 MAG: hypothetical protein A370_01922 [Clostridium sp. Maddingley MBC34-26]
MPTKSKNNAVKKPTTVVPIKRIKKKKETILIEVAKDQVIGEFINGFEVIKPIKRYGKYYVQAKNK